MNLYCSLVRFPKVSQLQVVLQVVTSSEVRSCVSAGVVECEEG